MRLISLRLRNFKGLREFTLDTKGRNVSVYSDNGVGKTTLVDAFTFCLFGKDSANRTDFEVLPLGPDGKRLIEITEALVEVVLSTDPEHLGVDPVTFKRIYSEKWVKRRGSTAPELAGHSTALFIDGVPQKEKDYKARVAALIDETRFRLLTNPRHFNDFLPWQERRRILLEVCGDVPDAEVVASEKALAELPGILGKYSADDYRKIAQGKRTDLNKALAEIPTRIDEAQRALPDGMTGVVPDTRPLLEMRATLLNKKASIQAGGGVAEKTKELREVEAQILQMENQHTARIERDRSGLRQQIEALRTAIQEDEALSNLARHAIAANEAVIADSEAALAELAKAYREVAASTFSVDATCPTCGQQMPADRIEAARAEWNLARAKRLENIGETGKRRKEAIEAARQSKDRNAATIDQAGQRSSVRALDRQSVQDRLLTLDETIKARPASPEYLALHNRKRQLMDTIALLQAGSNPDTSEIDRSIAALDEQIAAAEKAQAQAKQRDQGLQRIEQLRADQRRLAAELEQIEKALYLMDLFTRTKVAMLTDKINGRFKMARFKLFEQQVNGGLAPVCETTYNGVPWSGGLNNGAQIAVGLDIIGTLSEFYGVKCPVWIDNHESVLHLPDMTCQVISLYVSGPDKTLRVVQG